MNQLGKIKTFGFYYHNIIGIKNIQKKYGFTPFIVNNLILKRNKIIDHKNYSTTNSEKSNQIKKQITSWSKIKTTV